MLKNQSSKYRLIFATLFFSLVLSGCASLNNLSDAVQDLTGSILGNQKESEPPAALTEYKIEVELDVL
ncbi:MAG: hypothetical protein GQ569_09065, partial [Methylococcaceae bacterium]|nr:hypothetical protein [Methylococcaceae bacterium]